MFQAWIATSSYQFGSTLDVSAELGELSRLNVLFHTGKPGTGTYHSDQIWSYMGSGLCYRDQLRGDLRADDCHSPASKVETIQHFSVTWCRNYKDIFGVIVKMKENYRKDKPQHLVRIWYPASCLATSRSPWTQKSIYT